MKRIILQLIASLIIINIYSQDEWFLQNSGTTTLLMSVYFTTNTTGWASVNTFDNTKHLRYTNDGGITWSAVETGISDEWAAMYFTSWDAGYLAGWNGNIAKVTYNSVAGKYTFTVLKNVSASLSDIYFVDFSTGWAVGSGGIIFKTDNAGFTWDAQTSNTENNLRAVYFTDASYGWAVGDYGTIVQTSNGGTTWNLQTSPHSSWQYDVQFFDRNNGWIAANEKLLHTTDGGANWEYVSSSIGTNLFLRFTNSLNGWVCGNWGYISHTNDGGQTWYTQNSNTNVSFMDIFFYDSYTGWIVGEAGKIIKTTTGGCENFAVDLGADTSICDGKSFTFYPPYGNGYKYSWNTGSTSSFLTVNGPGTYSVNVTNTCNTAHSDAVNLIVHPLPVINLGNDQSFCYGESVMLDAGPGYQYSWTGGSSSQTLTVNSTGTYTGTITDINTCQNSDTVNILVYPLPIIDLGNDKDICEDQSVILDAGSNLEYLWDDGSSGQAREISASGKYYVRVIDANLCKNSDTIRVDVHPLPQIAIQPDGPSKLCKGEILNLNTSILNNDGSSSYQYRWNDSPVSATGQFQVDTSGLYKVTVAENHGCSNESALEVFYQYPFENEEIGLVTVDPETGDNLVVWERTRDKGTSYYKIYRGPDSIGIVNFNSPAVFQDIGTRDDGISYRYEIAVVDTCGHESLYSTSHKTMHLTASVGVANEVNLAWNHYEGFPVAWYYIYRGTDSINLQLYDSVQYDITTLAKTDYNPPVGTAYYRIGVKAPRAYDAAALNKAGTGPYSQSMSNIEDNRLKTGINDPRFAGGLTVFPNPFNETTTLKFPNPENKLFRLKVADLTGKILHDIYGISGSDYVLERGALQKGYYIIELSGDKVYKGKILIE
jgi:photosystem II stability/assembly factor-like uncharacterized protein